MPSDEDLFAYIADMCSELRTLAVRPSFRTLNYLLDMARLEAERMVKDMRSPRGGATSRGGR